MYIIIEIQTNADGTIGNLVYTAATRNEADSIYYQKLGYAAISQLPKHAVALMSNEGFPLMHQCYRHKLPVVPVEEPEPEGETEPEPIEPEPESEG